MRFFKVVFTTLIVIAVVNLMKVAVDWCIQPQVYLCSEVVSIDPINVQKKCGKWRSNFK